MSAHSSINSYTPDEMMTVAAARLIWPGCVCFVGIGVPSAAANLARLTHAPDIVLIYESGGIGTQPKVLPLSIAWTLARHCRVCSWMVVPATLPLTGSNGPWPDTNTSPPPRTAWL